MISSYNTDINFCEKNSITYYEFDLLKGKEQIGRYNLSVTERDVYFALFSFNEDYRGQGLAREALKLIYENIKIIAKEHTVNELEICASPIDKSITLDKLANLYRECLNVVEDYDNDSSLIMRGNL